ncbi:unnamed protein product [Acanthoscelides obtectus]|uniref:Uncharacterized protein n=1 Tax=Acanthoscelides obtectus TaxID=200917 RepID=A0A9P0PPL3_ACAOB|nr:unnamed protein product [Acanthoscelides obtectus]CAK1624375.1 hypothetical protein AOBTE_LOCUS2528 [Acanthoscelides obtectus]
MYIFLESLDINFATTFIGVEESSSLKCNIFYYNTRIKFLGFTNTHYQAFFCTTYMNV